MKYTREFARQTAEWSAQILILIFATTTVAMPCVIPSAAMEGTLTIGDHVIVDKLAYAPSSGTAAKFLPYQAVRRGDIVVFRYPKDIRQNYVKRVIGIPGDRIHMEAGAVVRNGVKLTETYVQHLNVPPDTYRDNFPVNGEVLVPEGQCFDMGDNRDNSEDSRYWGYVPRENIIGKPVLVYWSYAAPTEDLMDFTVHHAVDLALNFFTKTRWDRTLKPIRP